MRKLWVMFLGCALLLIYPLGVKAEESSDSAPTVVEIEARSPIEMHNPYASDARQGQRPYTPKTGIQIKGCVFNAEGLLNRMKEKVTA